MTRDDDYLRDILTSARLAQQYVASSSREGFLADMQLQDSVIRRIEVIGEVAKRLSETTRQAIPEVPWKQIAGMRDVLIHNYGEVDVPRVWDTVSYSLPPLISAVERFLQGRLQD